MTWSQTLHTAWSAVRTHVMRSSLTVLGILIGIAAVILTVGLGLGSQRDVSARIDAAELERLARADARIVKALGDREVVRAVVRPPKVVSFSTR